MTRMCRRTAVSTASAVVLLAFTASVASAEPTRMTGCLTPFGTLNNLAPGDRPARACGPKAQLVHLQLAAPLGKTAKRVFVTSQTFTANLGGVAGAHAKCQAAADAAGLGGTWRALISDDTTGPATDPDFTRNDGPYVRLDGVMIASNWDDLTDNSEPAIFAAINVTENGDKATPDDNQTYVATGYLARTSAQCTCNNWTKDVDLPDVDATIGNFETTFQWGSPGWFNGSGLECDRAKVRLYCFEQ